MAEQLQCLFQRGQRSVDDGIVPPFFNRAAGMRDRRAVPGEKLSDLRIGEAECHMSEIHRRLSHVGNSSHPIPATDGIVCVLKRRSCAMSDDIVNMATIY